MSGSAHCSTPVYNQTARLELLRWRDCSKLVGRVPASYSNADSGQTSIDFEQCNYGGLLEVRLDENFVCGAKLVKISPKSIIILNKMYLKKLNRVVC